MRLNEFFEYFLMLSRNIIFQGVLYMSVGEKTYKILITLLLSVFIYVFLHNIFVSVICGHLLNYILNGQFYVVHRVFFPNANMNATNLKKYLLFVDKIIAIFKPLDVLIIGGFSRGIIKTTSDLDMRIYHSNTLSGSTRAYLMATFLRFHGLVTRVPIDVFCFSNLEFLDKIRKDEIPCNFNGNPCFLEKYPRSINWKIQTEKVLFS